MADKLGMEQAREAVVTPSVCNVICGVSTEAATVKPNLMNVCIHLTSRVLKSMLIMETFASTVGATAEPSENVEES